MMPLPVFYKYVLRGHGGVSHKPWVPIFTVGRRPYWVQQTVFELLRQLRALRTMRPSLPNIDILSLPRDRQVRVCFGDLEALCNSVVSTPLLRFRGTADARLISRMSGIRSPSVRGAWSCVRGSRRPWYAMDHIQQGTQSWTL